MANDDPQTHILIEFVGTMLAPMFLIESRGDVGLARNAALKLVSDYMCTNHADLLTVAQIIAFGIAALHSLSLSMQDDIEPPMVLKLHRNAIACNRAADRNRAVLRDSHRRAQAQRANHAERTGAPATRAQREQAAWAEACDVLAAELTAEAATMPEAEARDAAIQAAAFRDSAKTIRARATRPGG